MTSKERMMIAMANKAPDMVPVAPDISNMIPCKLTGKPFWDIYLYEDPPLWQAYIDAVHYFGFDGWLPNVPIEYACEVDDREQPWREAIVRRSDERIVTRFYRENGQGREWSQFATIYFIDAPPYRHATLEQAALPAGEPDRWEAVEKRTSYFGYEAYHEAYARMGESGVIGLQVSMPGLNIKDPDSMYRYYDDRESVLATCAAHHDRMIARTREIIDIAPDFLFIGNSGHMLANPEPIFRELSLPTLRETTALAKQAGMLSQVHCCGPERDLVRIGALETDLDSINPLEIPASGGDCVLRELKETYGEAVGLMGNLHTVDVMLNGSVALVEAESRKAIDDAAEGGGFILSTGDQCGRDTPFKNIEAMIRVARSYGRY